MSSVRRLGLAALEQLRRPQVGLLWGYLCLSLALQVSDGRGLEGLAPLLLALACLALVVWYPADGGISPRHLGSLVAIETALALARRPGALIPDRPLRVPFLLLAGTTALVAWLATRDVPVARALRGARGAILLGILGLAAGGLLIATAPDPPVDAFRVQQQGAADLMAGKNPYQSLFPNPYSPPTTEQFFGDRRQALRDYPYPPLSLLLTVPGRALGGDVRWSLLVGQVATGLLLWRVAWRRRRGSPLGLVLFALHLLQPRGLFTLEQGWTEPLAGLFWIGLLAAGEQAPRLVGLSLGLWLGIKQYGLLALPLVGRRRGLGWALALVVATLVPFLAWDARAFLDDVVLFQLRQPFRPDALSLSAALAALTGWRAPGALALIVAGIVLAASWRRSTGSPFGTAVGAALVYFTFFLFAKQAFCNYYYLVGVLLLGAAALAPDRQSEMQSNRASPAIPNPK